MEYLWKDLLAARVWSWAALVLAGLLLVVLCANGALSNYQKGWLGIAAYLALIIFFFRPLISAAHAGPSHLLTVCVWSFVLVLLGVVLSYFAFYEMAGTDTAKFDKVLNVVPVLVAIWAAVLGWFVHFRLTTKAHRTNNAFSIVMETRKSAEYLRRAEMVTKHFPSGHGIIPAEYHQYFPQNSWKLYEASCQASKTEPDLKTLEMLEALRSLKYILNYYEFMAVGIRANDLDEDLLYNTVSESVVAIFDRAEPYVTWFRKNGQPLAFIDLTALTKRWRERLVKQKADHQLLTIQ